MGVERVQPVQRERLGRGEALPGCRLGAVVHDHAVLQREPALAVESGREMLRQHAQAQLDVAEQPALVAALDLDAVAELARLAEIVDDGGAQQQVAVEPRVQRARLERERGHGDGVLEQAAEVGVVAGLRARRSGRAGARRSARGARRQRARREPDLRAQALVG